MTHTAASDLGALPRRPADRSVVARTVLDAWESSVAVLRADGTIEVVNEAWERFAVDDGGAPEAVGVGANYFEVCERSAASEPATTATLDGL